MEQTMGLRKSLKQTFTCVDVARHLSLSNNIARLDEKIASLDEGLFKKTYIQTRDARAKRLKAIEARNENNAQFKELVERHSPKPPRL
tara:strand:+ start:199 stop:462 length:264 start_codon:yes stop_codon:yes gene_type:complete